MARKNIYGEFKNRLSGLVFISQASLARAHFACIPDMAGAFPQFLVYRVVRE